DVLVQTGTPPIALVEQCTQCLTEDEAHAAWSGLAVSDILPTHVYVLVERVAQNSHPRLVQGAELWLTWRDWRQGERRWRDPSMEPVASRAQDANPDVLPKHFLWVDTQVLQENYGSAESLISLLVRERRLAQACQYIFNEKADKRLFVDVVAHHCLAHNQFHELQKVILDFDPSLQKVQEYLNSVKEFLRDRRALDLLYSYEVFTRNFVNAGFLAISLFVQSSTWDARVGHLQNAEAHLGFAHRKLLSRKKGEGKDGTGDGTSENPSAAAQESMTASGDAVSLEAKMGIADIKRNLETVRIQRAVCEAMPTSMPQNAVLFGDLPAQCEVAELLMVNGHFKLALK
ncbi:unnamed protein product, partial [Symbiodinium necroappetens]